MYCILLENILANISYTVKLKAEVNASALKYQDIYKLLSKLKKLFKSFFKMIQI